MPCHPGEADPQPVATREGRLFCAANLAYHIQADGTLDLSGPWWKGAGFREAPSVIRNGPALIHAGIIGRNTDGIVIAFRGTVNAKEETHAGVADWINNGFLSPAEPANGGEGRVHEGFSTALGLLWPSLLDSLAKLQARPWDKLYFTGHSKGGALAVLAACRWLDEAGEKPAVGGITTFAAPRCANKAYLDKLAGTDYTRYENAGDLVPLLPPSKKTIALLQGIPGLGESLQKAAEWEYDSGGRLQYIRPDGTISGESPLLEIVRTKDFIENVIKARDAHAIIEAHDHELGSAYQKAVAPDLAPQRPSKEPL